jgi:N-acetylmuramoyl-L-alanine amidase
MSSVAHLIFTLAGAAASSAPPAVTIVTASGEHRVAVRDLPGLGPVIFAAPVIAALRGTVSADGPWAEVVLDQRRFRLLLDAPLVTVDGRLLPLVVPATVRRDSLFLPLPFLTDLLPRSHGGRFRYEPRGARLIDQAPAVSVARVAAAPAPTPAPAPNAWGLTRRHRVTIDPGHGGVDPGNPGLFFPRGVQEKHVTLQIGLLVRDELQRRGVAVTMTRTRDTLIDLRDRGRYCRNDCELFVSLHVNSLPNRAGYTAVRGFETYILSEARTEDAARVARMENEAIRFEAPREDERLGGLDFILKDLQLNEHLRESARAAELVQAELARVHDGPNRGVKAGPFLVLNTAQRPAILVELGYSTNRQDARLMTEAEAQRRLARAVADAVTRYLVEFERRSDPDASPGATGRR